MLAHSLKFSGREENSGEVWERSRVNKTDLGILGFWVVRVVGQSAGGTATNTTLQPSEDGA